MYKALRNDCRAELIKQCIQECKLVSFLTRKKPGEQRHIPSLQTSLQGLCECVARFCCWKMALGSHPAPELHSRSDRLVHTEQRSAGSRWPKDRHAERRGHLQHSPPARSEASATQVWWLDSLRRGAARQLLRAVRMASRRHLRCNFPMF